MADDDTDIMGILSIVFAFIMPLVGIILGFIGYSNRKRDGKNTTLSLIGLIINGVFLLAGLLIVLLFSGIILAAIGAAV